MRDMPAKLLHAGWYANSIATDQHVASEDIACYQPVGTYVLPSLKHRQTNDCMKISKDEWLDNKNSEKQ